MNHTRLIFVNSDRNHERFAQNFKNMKLNLSTQFSARIGIKISSTKSVVLTSLCKLLILSIDSSARIGFKSSINKIGELTIECMYEIAEYQLALHPLCGQSHSWFLQWIKCWLVQGQNNNHCSDCNLLHNICSCHFHLGVWDGLGIVGLGS